MELLHGLTSSDARTVHTFTCTCFEAPPWNLLSPRGESLPNLRSGWRPENCPPTTALGNETHNVAMARELSPSQICPQRPHKQRLLSTSVVHRSQPPCPTTQPLAVLELRNQATIIATPDPCTCQWMTSIYSTQKKN
jgi:hypothetical protein